VTRRHALTDAEWAKLEPLLPKNNRRGHPFKGHRPVIDAILWVLATGAAWRDLPERFGPWQTAYDRFNRWRKDGTWDRIAAELLRRADEGGAIDPTLWCIDGTTVRASRSAAGARKKSPARRAVRPRPGPQPGRVRDQAAPRL
jgi:transposase